MNLKLNKRRFRILALLLAAALIIAALIFGLRALEDRISPEVEGSGTTTYAAKTGLAPVTADGVRYTPREGLQTLLLIGVGESGPAVDSGSYKNPGECDFVALAVFDTEAQTYTLLQLNRDTMLEIPVLGVNGRAAGFITAQLALAHTYGCGLEDSCKNTADAVRAFLNDAPVDDYLSIRMDAVGAVNDLVGGVTVEVPDDYTNIDPAFRKGAVILLTGDQALEYVRMRYGADDGTNVARMSRQRQYLAAFSDCVDAAMAQQDDFALAAYEAVGDYMVTSLTVDGLSDVLERLSAYELTAILTPEGEASLGAEFMEFYADPAALQQLLLEVFYEAQ